MLDHIKARTREVARLTFEGFTPKDIAHQLDINVMTVRNMQADPLFQAAVKKLQDKADTSVIDVRKKLTELSKPALDVFSDLLLNDGVPHSVQLRAAQDVLDRNGYATIKETRNLHVGLSLQDIDEIKRRAVEGGYVVEDDEDIIDMDEMPDDDPFQLTQHETSDCS